MIKNDQPQRKCVTVGEVIFFFVSGFLMLGGAALLVSRYAQKRVEWIVEDKLAIRNNSDMMDAWIHPKFPVYMKFYIFNVTNGEEYLSGGKPNLTEHGPYTYSMMSPRFDVDFYPNDTVTYRNNHTLYFERELSVGSEEDVFHHINIPLVTVSEMLKSQVLYELLKETGMYQRFLDWIGGEDLIETHTVKEIIFGYEERIFIKLNGILSVIGMHMETKFGPFHGFNNSDDGLFLVDTGDQNFSNFNVIERWNGDTELPYWSDKYANMVNGTDGSFLKPRVKKTEPRYLYFPQMHRSVQLDYEVDTTIDGIDAYRYHFSEDLLKNASVVPANKGFCVPKDNCFESGLLNVGSCGDVKTPIFLSLPQFFMGSPDLIDSVEGMHPNKTKHDSFFHVEPLTGAVLLSQRRLQINAHVKNTTAFTQMSNIQSVFFPYFWLSGEAKVSDEVASNLRKALLIIRSVGYIGYVLIGIGIIMCTFTMMRMCRRRRREYTILVDENEPSPGTSVDVEA